MSEQKNAYRFPLMVMAIFALVAAVWGGLVRMGWNWPVLQPALPISHGPLMVAGFFGALISLERAVAKGDRWTYIAPLLSGVGAVLLAVGVPGLIGPILLTLGSLWLVIIFIAVLRESVTSYTFVMALGALALLIGNLLWLFGWPVYMLVLWWAGFLILTIAGERLELGRLVQLSKLNQALFGLAVIVYLAGLIVASITFDLGVRIASIGTIGLGLWLLRYDIARRTVKMAGLTRFIAVCLLSGYVWLLVSGALGLIYGGIPAGPILRCYPARRFLGFCLCDDLWARPDHLPGCSGAGHSVPKLFLRRPGFLAPFPAPADRGRSGGGGMGAFMGRLTQFLGRIGICGHDCPFPPAGQMTKKSLEPLKKVLRGPSSGRFPHPETGAGSFFQLTI